MPRSGNYRLMGVKCEQSTTNFREPAVVLSKWIDSWENGAFHAIPLSISQFRQCCTYYIKLETVTDLRYIRCIRCKIRLPNFSVLIAFQGHQLTAKLAECASDFRLDPQTRWLAFGRVNNLFVTVRWQTQCQYNCVRSAKSTNSWFTHQ
jgi:hypothetical protein